MTELKLAQVKQIAKIILKTISLKTTYVYKQTFAHRILIFLSNFNGNCRVVHTT